MESPATLDSNREHCKKYEGMGGIVLLSARFNKREACHKMNNAAKTCGRAAENMVYKDVDKRLLARMPANFEPS